MGEIASVAQAVIAALDWNSSAETRHSASVFLDSIKSGDVRVLAATSFELVKPNWSSEIRHYGFKLLQHLVRLRWEELHSEERLQFVEMVAAMVCEVAKPHEVWVLKSQTAALFAEVARRELPLWEKLLSTIFSLRTKSPIHAEMVAMVLRWLPEDITVHNEDLEGDRRRQLVRSLKDSLPYIFDQLHMLFGQYLGATVNAVEQNQMDVAKQNAATVTAALNAVNAYAEWVPVPLLGNSHLTDVCGHLLRYREFRLIACEFFKMIALRRRPSDETLLDFDSTMACSFDIVMNSARDFLENSASGISCLDDSEVEFAECICLTMVALGCNNLQCIAGHEERLSLYLLEFLLRGSSSNLKTNEQVEGSRSSLISGTNSTAVFIDKEKKGMTIRISDDFCGIILDVAFQRMLKKNPTIGLTLSNNSLEIWSDDFASKSDFGQYRGKLIELIRLIGAQQPVIAASRISQRIEGMINLYLVGSIPSQDLAVLEGTQLALDTTISAIFDGASYAVNISSPAVHHTLHTILGGILQRLCSLNWTEPAQVEIIGRLLDAMGPYLKHFPEAVGSIINKLFDLLKLLPVIQKGHTQDLMAVSMSRARLQICTSFIRIAQAAATSLLPHMEQIAGIMARLEVDGQLRQSEHNLLGEAFLIMASAAGSEQQQKILAWLLEPISKQWLQMEWQTKYLSEPMGLVHLLTRGPNTSENELMWYIFHTITFYERALKRCGSKKTPHCTSQESSVIDMDSAYVHPLASHLSWMLPPLLKVLRCIHSLWSQAIVQALPVEMRAALLMSPAEQSGLLGEVAPKSKGMVAGDGSQLDFSRPQNMESKENEIRNWLKGVRDSGYILLGLATGIGDQFYNCVDSDSLVVALLENIEAMHFRHIRQLIHSVLTPFVKTCPTICWGAWLGIFLPRLLGHCQKSLIDSWSSLIWKGRANVPDCCGDGSAPDLKAEVMEEKILRDLTRETCGLLAALASPGANKSLPSSEQIEQLNRMESSPLIDTEKIASESLIGFLFKHNDGAVPALQICLKAFSWPDSEAVAKVVLFCGSVVMFAVSTNNIELQQFVAKDLFEAVIQGLTLESNAMIHAELISLCREIFIQLSTRHLARQVLLSQLSVTPDALSAFENALLKTSSAKEQKQHMKSLLLSAAGSQLKALLAQKNTKVITNVTLTAARSLQHTSESTLDEGDTIGLAAVNTAF
ncbi:protein HASTY 1 isoform X2 [Cryptomeria japonica]|uniref:protein HASTY 1 isoform X2 n=1 Tax=Cryptomeria japonica TaxID=3369 RepID=UPI0027DA3AF6|nr:protein HASTY 1 isoform X2 [Cryptomeria japonica]